VHARLVPELRVAAGYDDNLFLGANLAGPTQIRGDAIFDVEPRLAARLQPARHTLTLAADFLERITPSNGDLRDFTARLEYATPPLGPVELFAAGAFEYYGASLFPADTFDLGGGEAGLRVSLGLRALATAGWRGSARSYPTRTQLDFEQRAFARAHVLLHRLVALDGGYLFLHVASTDSHASLDRHAGDLALTLRPLSRLAISVGYGFAGQHLPDGMTTNGAASAPRTDYLHSIDVLITARPVEWLELFARGSFIIATSDAPAGAYNRDQALAGLALVLDVTHTWRRAAAAAAVEPDGVVFCFQGRAARVSVVGDWNGWDPSAQPLAEERAGRFRARVAVPGGRHEYAFVVDGQTVSPPDAAQYVPDGFGGQNGVLTVSAVSKK
jgi:Glycogen recognition site of AMP-activated protein kinase